jgi:hypothetical protein
MTVEYRVIPAPARGVKGKGVKGPEGRFAHGLEQVLNEMGAEGWEFLRAETLPSDERVGLTGSHRVWRHVLVFRRSVAAEAVAEPAEPLARLPASAVAAAAVAAPAVAAPVTEEAEDDAPESDDMADDAAWPEDPSLDDDPAEDEDALLPDPEARADTRAAHKATDTDWAGDNGVEDTGPADPLSLLAQRAAAMKKK